MNEPISPTTDKHLWLALREGSESAFDLLYEALFPILYNYGYHLSQDEELVKDCIQNIFIEVWQRRSRVQEVFSLKHYFLKIMRRKVLHELTHRRKVDAQKLASHQLLSASENQLLFYLPHSIELTEEETVKGGRILKDAIEKLSSRKKEAILLKFYENLTYTEISEVMELKDAKYARQLVYRSLDELRKSLKTRSVCLSEYVLYILFLWYHHAAILDFLGGI